MSNLNLFSQIISKIDRSAFNKLVEEKQTDKHQKGFNSWTHLVSMLFCHFAKSTSVRDISNGLRSATGNLNHLGVRRAPSKSSISYQNVRREADLFRELYYSLLNRLGQQTKQKRVKLKIKVPVYLLDATVISLCLSVFDWATFRSSKGAVKMHTLLDYDGKMPIYVNITEGSVGDNKGAYQIPLQKGTVIVADRYYNDFPMLNVWDSKGVNFVIRHKNNLAFSRIEERELPQNTAQHILIDEIIELSNPTSKKKYPKRLRRVAVWDEENNQTIELITNNLKWAAQTIGDLYKSRWEIEVFFRDIKSLLHIKTFIGTSKNAVMIQIWTALITILMLKAMKNQAKYNWHLSNLVAFIRLNIFVKINLQKWLDQPFEEPPNNTINQTQGVLFADYT
tara:strand:+ start:611 stop:1792 length:1182 start_codon:yes stop_codon:yes gene_type:complete